MKKPAKKHKVTRKQQAAREQVMKWLEPGFEDLCCRIEELESENEALREFISYLTGGR